MMTLDERAHYVATQIGASTEHEFNETVTTIRSALIEQDKITRHAAAEEVLTVLEHIEYDGLIDKDEAHSRVMNCTGGMK